MQKEAIKSDILISSQNLSKKEKLISFTLGISENNTNQNSFRKISKLKFKTTKNSPDKDNLINEEKKILEQICLNQRKTDEFLKQQLLRKKELSTLKRKNLSNPSKQSDSNNRTNINNNSNPNEFKKRHINLLTSNLNYKKGIFINSSISSPRQKTNKQKLNSDIVNPAFNKKNNNNQNKNFNNLIINSKNNLNNKNNKNEHENKNKNFIKKISKKKININNSNYNKNSLINEKEKSLINDLMLSKQKISQTTPVTNTNSRKTSNEKKISTHNFNQSKKNSILTNLTHNKHNFFHSNNTEDIFSCSSINNLKTNYSNEKYHLSQNQISKNLLSSSGNFKCHLTTENSPSYYNKKNLVSKSKRNSIKIKNQNILFHNYNIKPSTLTIKKGNYTTSTSKDALTHNAEIEKKIITSSKTSTHSLSKTISHKSSINKINKNHLNSNHNNNMTLNINKKNTGTIPRSGKGNYVNNNNNHINKKQNDIINQITNSNNVIQNKTKKMIKENNNNNINNTNNNNQNEENNIKSNQINNINQNQTENPNPNISISTFKDDETLNESKLNIKNTQLKEGIYYLKQSEKLSSYLKKYYEKYHEYPPTKLSFYKFGRLIGRGAFGKVNLALHILTGKIVAIKSFNKSKQKNSESINKIYHEINLMKTLRHNSIVRILETIETENYILIIMENISGGNLLSFVKKRTKLNEKTAHFIFRQLISSIKFIHSKGIIHRDIKLDNILIDLNNTIKICDFGVGKNYKKNEKLKDQCGTPAYIAPEILQNNDGYYGPPVDIWSSGVVLYAMLSGNVPFKANNIKDLHQVIINGNYHYIKDISNDARNLIKKILEVDPNKRIDIEGILNHPWMISNDNFDEKNSLFTKAEIVLLSKENVDYRYCDKSEMIENFTMKNLYTVNDKENKNICTKSDILAPFNSSFIGDDNNNVNNYDNKLEKSLEICNNVIQFNENTKVLNRLYELNNNGEIDHGVLINQNSDKKDNEEKLNEINDLDDDLLEDNINKKQSPNIINQNENSKRNDSYLTNSSSLIIDENILKNMEILGYKKDYIQKILNANEFNYASATYYLLSNQNDVMN